MMNGASPIVQGVLTRVRRSLNQALIYTADDYPPKFKPHSFMAKHKSFKQGAVRGNFKKKFKNKSKIKKVQRIAFTTTARPLPDFRNLAEVMESRIKLLHSSCQRFVTILFD